MATGARASSREVAARSPGALVERSRDQAITRSRDPPSRIKRALYTRAHAIGLVVVAYLYAIAVVVARLRAILASGRARRRAIIASRGVIICVYKTAGCKGD